MSSLLHKPEFQKFKRHILPTIQHEAYYIKNGDLYIACLFMTNMNNTQLRKLMEGEVCDEEHGEAASLTQVIIEDEDELGGAADYEPPPSKQSLTGQGVIRRSTRTSMKKMSFGMFTWPTKERRLPLGLIWLDLLDQN
jgi:hypothetical protein